MEHLDDRHGVLPASKSYSDEDDWGVKILQEALPHVSERRSPSPDREDDSGSYRPPCGSPTLSDGQEGSHSADPVAPPPSPSLQHPPVEAGHSFACTPMPEADSNQTVAFIAPFISVRKETPGKSKLFNLLPFGQSNRFSIILSSSKSSN